MKVCFYCSYNLSPTGFQTVTLHPETGCQDRAPFQVEAVRTLLTHGGAKSAIGFDGSAYYLVLKDMRKTKEELPLNTPGRDWFMNYALAATEEEVEALCAAAYFGYTAYQDFVSRLAACLTPREEETSYAVDADSWRALMAEASARYQAFLESGEADFSDAPGGLGLEQMGEALDILRSRKIKGLYEFALLEGEEDYFLSLNGCEDPAQLRHYVKMNGGKKEAPRRSVKSAALKTHKRAIPKKGLLLGGAIIFACSGLQAIRRAKRRRKRRVDSQADSSRHRHGTFGITL